MLKRQVSPEEVPPSRILKPSSRLPLILRQGRFLVMAVMFLTLLVAWGHLDQTEEITAKKKALILNKIFGIGRRVGLPLPQGARRHLQQLRLRQ